MTYKRNHQLCLTSLHGQNKRSQNKTSHTLDANIVLDTKIWNELPSNIIKNILKHLLISMLFKLRIVCKEWNALPTFPYFCDFHIGDQTPNSSYLLRFQNEQLKNGEVCNLENKKFVKMDFTFVLNAIRSIANNIHLDGSKIKIKNAISSGGLLCMITFEEHYILVCNPLTKACKCISQQSSHE